MWVPWTFPLHVEISEDHHDTLDPRADNTVVASSKKMGDGAVMAGKLIVLEIDGGLVALILPLVVFGCGTESVCNIIQCERRSWCSVELSS